MENRNYDDGERWGTHSPDSNQRGNLRGPGGPDIRHFVPDVARGRGFQRGRGNQRGRGEANIRHFQPDVARGRGFMRGRGNERGRGVERGRGFQRGRGGPIGMVQPDQSSSPQRNERGRGLPVFRGRGGYRGRGDAAQFNQTDRRPRIQRELELCEQAQFSHTRDSHPPDILQWRREPRPITTSVPRELRERREPRLLTTSVPRDAQRVTSNEYRLLHPPYPRGQQNARGRVSMQRPDQRGRGNFRGGRGGFQGGRHRPIALMRNQLTVNNNLTLRRLQKDYFELKNSEVPLFGVAAAPEENDMKVWHINVRAPDSSPWKGGIFHMIITFPNNYPACPPTIISQTKFTHPNAFPDRRGLRICLEQLEKQPDDGSRWYEGWQSSYTVESILIQLQAFFGEKKSEFMEKEQLVAAMNEVENANSFKCSGCRHRGSIELFPPFNEKEQDLAQFVILPNAKELLAKEFVCYHTKIPLAETTLGIGVSLNRTIRTGEISNVNPTLDLLSNKAFTKNTIRKSIANEKFNYWFPLYFGESKPYETKKMVFDEATQSYKDEVKTIDPKERFVHLLKKKLCFMTKQSTRLDFHSNMVFQILPKLIITHLVSLADDKKHCSIIAIRRLINFIRVFRFLIELYPDVMTKVNLIIETFINSPEKRHKDHTPSLGDLLVYVLVSDKYKIQNILDMYTEEQLDRQVFWILLKIPELDHTAYCNRDKHIIIEEARSEACFKTGMTGFHLTMIVFELAQLLDSRYDKQLAKFDIDVDTNFGCLPMDVENQFQNKLKQIKKVDNFKRYYQLLGIDCPEEDALTARMRQAVTNSRKKNYHGGSDECKAVWESAKILEDQQPNAFSFYSNETNQFTDSADPCWKQACFDRFPWVKRLAQNSHKQFTSSEVAAFSDNKAINILDIKVDALKQMILKDVHKYDLDQIKSKTAFEDYPETFTWRHLFHKLCFEQILAFYATGQIWSSPLKFLYKYIDQVGKEITVLKIQLFSSRLKSKNYWLMALLSHLPMLKSVKFYRDGTDFTLQADYYKFMDKGMKYLTQNGTKLNKIQFYNMLGDSTLKDKLYSILSNIPQLICLNFSHCNPSLEEARAIKKILQTCKTIRELDISNCNLDQDKTKEIADGFMRSKQLQILKAANNPGMGEGLNQILYNLAFAPQVKYIDVTKAQANQETFSALTKLLQYSSTIETLIMKHTNILAYFKVSDEAIFALVSALADSQTMIYLNMDQETGDIEDSSKPLLFLIGVSAWKKGSLRAFSAKNWLNKQAKIPAPLAIPIDESFYSINGSVIQPPSEWGTFLNLDFLDLGSSDLSLLTDSFNPKELEKQTKPQWPQFLIYATLCQLDLNFSNSKLPESSATAIAMAISNNPFGACKIQSLDLSKNNFAKNGKLIASAIAKNSSLMHLDLSQCGLGVSGMQALCLSLKVNQTLQKVNLYRNIIDVNGARALGDALAVNKTLEFIDIGHNRIRCTGLKAVVDGIAMNPSSKLSKLAIRANFINDEGARYLFQHLVFKKQPQLTHIFLKQNLINENVRFILYNQIKSLQHFEIKVAPEDDFEVIPMSSFNTYSEDWQVPEIEFELQADLSWADQTMIYVDEFENIDLLDEKVISKSMWLAPLPRICLGFEAQIVRKLTTWSCGLVVDVRIRQGKKVKGRKDDNFFAVIEFANDKSIGRAIKYQKDYNILQYSGTKQRLFKAGTRTVNPFKAFLSQIREDNKRKRN